MKKKASTAASKKKQLTAEEKAKIDSNYDGMAAKFAEADSRAIQIHELLVRKMKMTEAPNKRHLLAKAKGFDEQMRAGRFEDLGFIQEAFLAGAEIGADDDVKKVLKQTSPEAQQDNAEKGNDRAIRKRQKRKADKRKADASADRKQAAIEMMFQLVDGVALEKRMKQIPASNYVWGKKYSHLKGLSVKPSTIRRWYSEEKQRRLKANKLKVT